MLREGWSPADLDPLLSFHQCFNWKIGCLAAPNLAIGRGVPRSRASPHLRTATREPGPDRQAETAQRDHFIADCIRTLPDVYQSALRLYYWLGAGVGEVAELLDIPENIA